MCVVYSLKMEFEKLAQEKTEMQRHYVMVSRYCRRRRRRRLHRAYSERVRLRVNRQGVLKYACYAT